ncbi:MAG: hypothetical protein M3T56_11390 [Chloroflexota bacterium]|nr:hypothetical protein [Chloroflexota bacterium]
MSTYEFDPEASNDEGVIRVKLSGRAQPETIVRLLRELNAIAERNASMRVLIDETDLRAGFIGPSDIGRIAQAWRKATALRSSRIAAYASNPVIYGLNRMFQGLAEGTDRVSVFNDRARAKAWLLED